MRSEYVMFGAVVLFVGAWVATREPKLLEYAGLALSSLTTLATQSIRNKLKGNKANPEPEVLVPDPKA